MRAFCPVCALFSVYGTLSKACIQNLHLRIIVPRVFHFSAIHLECVFMSILTTGMYIWTGVCVYTLSRCMYDLVVLCVLLCRIPLALTWCNKTVQLTVYWFQRESDPERNSNAYDVAQKVINDQFPGQTISVILFGIYQSLPAILVLNALMTCTVLLVWVRTYIHVAKMVVYTYLLHIH